FNIYGDNYFTKIPLFQVCYSHGIGACGTEDSGSVYMLTTIHQITDYVNCERKKPRSTSANAATTRGAFGPDRGCQVFAILQVINDYTHYMNGVDRADQLHAFYPTQPKAQRNWLPLFYWLVDTSIVNSFVLFWLLYLQAQ
ncbi:hypothetical protein C7212DRAFT_58795, partial [Tuber magnatum]